MAKISDYAKEYNSPAKTKNIAELLIVSTDLELVDDEFDAGKEGEVKIVKQKVIVVDGEQYRVPVSVIQQLKVILEDNPALKKFKVKKTGTTKDDTRYTVIPLMG